MVLANLLCAVFRAQRGKPHTIKKEYRSAEGKNVDRVGSAIDKSAEQIYFIKYIVR
jgi:hypothetical protein